jgi:hypothetical protein
MGGILRTFNARNNDVIPMQAFGKSELSLFRAAVPFALPARMHKKAVRPQTQG